MTVRNPYPLGLCSVLPDGSGRAFLRQDKFETEETEANINGPDKETYRRRQAAKEAAAAAVTEEQKIHESPGQKI